MRFGCGDFSVPRSYEKILRTYRLILPKYHLILPKKFFLPTWIFFIFHGAISEILRKNRNSPNASELYSVVPWAGTTELCSPRKGDSYVLRRLGSM